MVVTKLVNSCSSVLTKLTAAALVLQTSHFRWAETFTVATDVHLLVRYLHDTKASWL